jgi:myo-inositol-1(or 4)-monophosphatase
LPEADLELLIQAAQEAGRIASKFADTNAKVWEKPGGAGPVTEADLAVNKMLETELLAARPDYGWLSEESVHNDARQKTDRVFIVDPIDGTRSFIEGSDTWAHSLAVAEKGEVVAAVVYLPKRRKIYTAARGQGAFLNDHQIAVGQRDALEGAEVLAARPVMDAQHWSKVPQFFRSHRPSLAYRLSLVAEGRYDAMLTLRPTWEWDVAAGDLILREAGAETADKTGAPLVFNNPDPRLRGMIAGNAQLMSQIKHALI